MVGGASAETPKLDVDAACLSRDPGQAADIAGRIGVDGLFFSEVNHDPLILAARSSASSGGMDLGTAVAIAFARNPMSLALAAWDLQEMCGGRFILGIGSQVRAHITRRYSMPWSDPVARMGEFVAAMREIWRSFVSGDELRFRGDHYTHSLLPPVFRPEPTSGPLPLVALGAIGAAMTRLAAVVADGVLLHPLATRSYVEVVVAPLIARSAMDRDRLPFVRAMPYLATGPDDEALERSVGEVRRLIAFHGSTPAYRPILAHHGLDDLHVELHRLSRRGAWSTMASLVDDDVVETFAVVGGPGAAGKELTRRYGGCCDRLSFHAPAPLAETVWAEVLDGARTRPDAP